MSPIMKEVEISIRRLKNYKSPGFDKVPAELIKYTGPALQKAVHENIIVRMCGKKK